MNKNIENWAQAWQLISISASPPSLFPILFWLHIRTYLLIQLLSMRVYHFFKKLIYLKFFLDTLQINSCQKFFCAQKWVNLLAQVNVLTDFCVLVFGVKHTFLLL